MSDPHDFLGKLFISHASEDKECIARPLADALIEAGYRVWFDQYSLTGGDSLKTSIDDGLAECDFGIVILSPAFFAKPWPREELDGLATGEIARNKKVIIPIWHNISFAEMAKRSPTLAGKLGIPSDAGTPIIVDAITRSINKASAFVGRKDLETKVIRVNPMNCISGDFTIVKRPEESWEAFGEALLEQMRKLDADLQKDDDES